MARPLRIEFEGALYHVMARGNAQADIFLDDEDRQAFVDNLDRVCRRFDWRVWAWCQMSNHYHLLIETLRPTLSKGMREVNGVYTQGFNYRHGRVGHVLQRKSLGSGLVSCIEACYSRSQTLFRQLDLRIDHPWPGH